MSGLNTTPAKRSHQNNSFAFPNNLEIPKSALSDRKFRSSYVRIFNDPRVYKRPRLNGDRTSSRFGVDHNYQIKVVFDEPMVKPKGILANTQSPKDDSGISKSVSFSSKITFIDSTDLDGVSSDCTDVEMEESRSNKSKTKSKKSKNAKSESKSKTKAAASNDKPSSKKKKKTKDKLSNKNGHKVKSTHKDLFKFKITKPFRKFGRSKDKKLKHLQKKFGRRMFKAFVQVKRSFNLKTIPEQVTVPLEKITLNATDVTTPKKSVPSIQDFLIGRMTKKVKVSLTPVQGNTDDTNEPMTTDGGSLTSVQANIDDTNKPMITGVESLTSVQGNTDDTIEPMSTDTESLTPVQGTTVGTNEPITIDTESSTPVPDNTDSTNEPKTTDAKSLTPVQDNSDGTDEPMITDGKTLSPVQDNADGTNESMTIDAEIIPSKENESNSSESVENSSRTEKDVQSDNPVDRQEIAENSEAVVPSTEPPNSVQLDQNGPTIQSNGDVGLVESDDSPDVDIDRCNDTDPSPEVLALSALPNLIDEITRSMYYNTNKDETVTVNGQMLGTDTDDHHGDMDDNISAFNVSFSMPTTKSLADNMLGCDSPEIASIQLEMND
ncbi:uncharacterized protein LOC119068637 isoform X1 [Bradysia coprophila]|uniref:uncharacterized protein LOC119068637 isoform X1 n=1 Tax=Bradysia coprophila TaxID=38358 RepID=UPI00187DDA4A|nr:uncharacterized protein LOC119068637 isoform X1 [Bradysia coprophila]XP_037028201.1 uncharacterized protein LOC119068637 isoform X1 [Bradysia coprophila]